MSNTDLYLRFVREDVTPEAGKLMQFAVVSFGGATLTAKEEQEFVNRFEALPSCADADFGGTGNDYRAIINSVRHGHPAEKDFVSAVETCAHRHYTVKRVTRPRN